MKLCQTKIEYFRTSSLKYGFNTKGFLRIGNGCPWSPYRYTRRTLYYLGTSEKYQYYFRYVERPRKKRTVIFL